MPQELNQQNEINYAKENVERFLPELLKFTDLPAFPWKRINDLFDQKIEERKNEAQGEMIEIQATAFDIVIAAKKGNRTATGLLLFLNQLFHDLSQLLTASQRQMVFTNIKNLLTRFDWRFYDYIGEIGVLYNILSTKMYRLLHVEEGLSNGKTVDFTVQDISTSTSYLVEVYNIHVDSDKVEADPDAIKAFFTKRLTDKIADKNKKRDAPLEFTLVPVIWGNVKDLRVYSQFFQDHPLDLPNVFEPFAWLQFSDDKGYYAHRFARITNLFKEFNSTI